MTDKQQLRVLFRRRRRALSDEEYHARCGRIIDRVRALPEYRGARVVHSYWPSPTRREVDTRPLLNDLAARNATVILPVVLHFGLPTGQPRLSHVRYQPGMEMQANRWDIPEPVTHQPARTDRLDLILVPALACDPRGVRLGNGYGYYDEFLAGATGLRVCLCMEEFIVNSLPAAPHDQLMDIVVSDRRTIRTEHRNMP